MTSSPPATPPRPITGLVLLGILAVAAGASVPLLRAQRESLVRETADIRRTSAGATRVRDSLAAVTSGREATFSLEQARATAREEPKLHLVVAVDSGTVALVRDGITLRSMAARFSGAEPERGVQSIASIIEVAAPVTAAPVVDSLGNPVAAPPAPKKVQRVALSDGTVLEAGDAASALLGGVERTGGPRRIIISRRDFAAIQPNLVRGMKAVLF